MARIKRQWTSREFIRVLRNNGFTYDRAKGSHYTYKNTEGKSITFSFHDLNCMLAHRLIKENNLEVKA